MRLVFTLLGLHMSIMGISQIGFFRADGLDVIRSFGNSVVEIGEDRYLGVGRFFRENWPDYNVHFTEFNGEGQVIAIDTFKDDFHLHHSFHNDLYLIDSTVFAIVSSYDHNKSLSNSYLLEYDVNKTEVRLIELFQFPESSCTGFVPLGEDDFFIVFSERVADSANLIKILRYTDGEITKQFYYNYGDDNVTDGIVKELVVTDDNTIILGGYISDTEAMYVPFFIEYGPEGDLLWEYKFSDDFEGYFIKDFILDNKELIISFSRREIGGSGGSTGVTGSEPRIVKLNKSTGVEWDKPFGQRIGTYHHSNSYNSILKAHELDGYILGGVIVNNDSLFHRCASIGKVSLEGDSIWHRRYSYTSEWNANNFLRDLEYTCDGGYVGIGGHVYGKTDSIYEGNTFRKTLFLKTDREGLIDGTNPVFDQR